MFARLRDRPRLVLVVAFVSWWWWVWIPWSDLFHVVWSWWTTVVLGVLVLFGALATAISGQRCGRLTLLALLGSPAVVVPVGLVIDVTRAFVAGEAEFMVGGRPALFLPYGRIDAETRIPLAGWGCMGPPPYAPIHNGALRVLHAVLGPMPGTYQGWLPDDAEVRRMLDERGVNKRRACDGHTLAVGRRWISFRPDRDLVCSADVSVARAAGERVAVVNEELIAVERQYGDAACGTPGASCRVYLVQVGSGRTLGSPPKDGEESR